MANYNENENMAAPMPESPLVDDMRRFVDVDRMIEREEQFRKEVDAKLAALREDREELRDSLTKALAPKNAASIEEAFRRGGLVR